QVHEEHEEAYSNLQCFTATQNSMKMKLLHVHEEHEEDYSKLTMFYCYAEFHEDSHRPLSRTQEKRHLQGIPFQTCCCETPLQLEESQTYLTPGMMRIKVVLEAGCTRDTITQPIPL
ncbi:unnamed protein product, partial [Musa hybrid cultivar]